MLFWFPYACHLFINSFDWFIKLTASFCPEHLTLRRTLVSFSLNNLIGDKGIVSYSHFRDLKKRKTQRKGILIGLTTCYQREVIPLSSIGKISHMCFNFHTFTPKKSSLSLTNLIAERYLLQRRKGLKRKKEREGNLQSEKMDIFKKCESWLFDNMIVIHRNSWIENEAKRLPLDSHWIPYHNHLTRK